MTFIKMDSVNIKFEKVTYTGSDKKIILNGIHGKFPAGKLTGILGPSGAGKSTLLNILAGLLHNGVSGNIFVNDKPRDKKSFLKIASYITQDDVIQNYLTVNECLHIAANLKLSKNVPETQKQKAIDLIIESMRLDQCIETKTEHLSGGQRKRLIVALELVNNPPLLFLDEPTTGLDEVTLLSCMKLFKKLTNEGRTVICTIHQPSDNVFSLFDHVYFLSNGKCVYEGSTRDLIPFLKELNFPCPTTYSPADYIIELVHENYEATTLLANHADVWDNRTKEYLKSNKTEELVLYDTSLIPLWEQVSILSKRRFTQMFRNKLHLSIEIGHNIFTGISIGLLFYKMGNNANTLFNNMFIFYAINIYLMFTNAVTMILLYPFEIKILQREYMNRWYDFKAYFLALTISNFPITCIGTIILSVIVYYMTEQPTDEIYRIFWFTLAMILHSLTSQGFGLIIASIFQPTNGACIGAAIAIVLLLLSTYGTGYGMQISQTMKFTMSLDYVYHAYTAVAVSIFRERSPANCDEIFCHFSNPQDVLKMMGMDENNYFPSIFYVCIFLVLHRIIAYVILKKRVKPDTALYKLLK